MYIGTTGPDGYPTANIFRICNIAWHGTHGPYCTVYNLVNPPLSSISPIIDFYSTFHYHVFSFGCFHFQSRPPWQIFPKYPLGPFSSLYYFLFCSSSSIRSTSRSNGGGVTGYHIFHPTISQFLWVFIPIIPLDCDPDWCFTQYWEPLKSQMFTLSGNLGFLSGQVFLGDSQRVIPYLPIGKYDLHLDLHFTFANEVQVVKWVLGGETWFW